jgi:hypothetical protein
MKLRTYLTGDSLPNMVGRESFDTFIKIAESVCEFSFLDVATSAANDRYQVYSSVVKIGVDELSEEFSKYKTMNIAKYWLDKYIPVGTNIKLYFSAYNTSDKWLIDYGIIAAADMYTVGRFNFNQRVLTNLPASKLLKNFKSEIDKYNLPTHAVFNAIRRDLKDFNPGPCVVNIPVVVDGEVVLSCKDLGRWQYVNGVKRMNAQDAEDNLRAFREYCGSKPWTNSVNLVLRLKKDGWADFVVQMKQNQQ